MLNISVKINGPNLLQDCFAACDPRLYIDKGTLSTHIKILGIPKCYATDLKKVGFLCFEGDDDLSK